MREALRYFNFVKKGTAHLDGEAKEKLASELMKLCRQHSVPFIVNDDIALAISIDADGVHVGQDDESVDEVRKKIGDKILGVSAHTMDEVAKAVKDGADYLGIGPVFPTDTKPDAKQPNGGILIRECRQAGIDIPIVGIGGITDENASFVIEAGSDGISLISAISMAESPENSSRLLRKAVDASLRKVLNS